MQEFLKEIIPNIMNKLPTFYKSIVDTLLMMGISGSISFAIGLVFGVILTITKKGAILENVYIYWILSKLINFFRSIPFIILLTWVLPISRAIMGTGIQVKGAIIPLVFGTVPFFSRQIETALAQVDKGQIEAALSMGSSPVEIIFRVYLRESIAQIIRVSTITAISLLNLTAMAGAVGAGGLGNFAIMYGHDRNQVDVTQVTVVLLVLMVAILQFFGDILVKKNTH